MGEKNQVTYLIGELYVDFIKNSSYSRIIGEKKCMHVCINGSQMDHKWIINGSFCTVEKIVLGKWQ